MGSYPWMSTFLADASQTAAMFLGALAGALLVLRVHIVYPLVIALVILAAVTVFAVTWARKPRTSRYPAT